MSPILHWDLVIVPVRGQRRKGCLVAQLVGESVHVQLPSHLEADYPWYPVEILTSLDLYPVSAGDAHIEVLADRAETPSDPACVPQQSSESESGLLGMLRSLDIWSGCDFHQRHPQPVEGVNHGLSR